MTMGLSRCSRLKSDEDLFPFHNLPSISHLPPPSHNPLLQVYAMDSAHLKETWNGQFGTLSFKDANNKIILVAVRVQGKENGEMYKKLLEKAMEAPALREILNNNKTTCFTDKHKGSDSAVPQMCPDTEHRRCVEHVLKLLSGTVIGQVSAVTSRRHFICKAGWVHRWRCSVKLWCLRPVCLFLWISHLRCYHRVLLPHISADCTTCRTRRYVTLVTELFNMLCGVLF